MRTERCETCRWWENNENKWTPRCHRYPRQLNPVRVSELVVSASGRIDAERAAAALQCWEFPHAAPDDFCGEWQPTPPAAD
jgi:hypothetical protein